MLTSMYVHIMKLSPSIVTRPSEDVEKSDGPASRNNTVYLLFMMIILSLFNIYNIFITSITHFLTPPYSMTFHHIRCVKKNIII